MSTLQKNILPVYIIIACFLMFIDFLFPGKSFVYLLKYLVVISLFLISLFQRKTYKEQWMMFTAQFFVVIADYFFVFMKWLTGEPLTNICKFVGIVCFFIAYLILIKTWLKNGYYQSSSVEIILALLIIILFWPTVVAIGPHLQLIAKLAALIFGIILCLLVWSGICTRIRNYYGRITSKMIGIASCLIFISDLAVAHASLNPAFSGQFIPWLSSLIWITYIPAWAIIVTLISLPNIYI